MEFGTGGFYLLNLVSIDWGFWLINFFLGMKFYNRESEIEHLHRIRELSLVEAQMTVVTGRRRIGKTQLLLRATEGHPTLYFFVARKAETLLCRDFQQEIERKLGILMVGSVDSFGELFRYLMILSKERAFNLIIDEFQEFYTVAPSVYSDMQNHWDYNKGESRMNLLLSGSVYSLMCKIFQGAKEPLFGRATAMIRVKPFATDVLKEILYNHNPNYTAEDLLSLYAFTGGVAKYVQLLMDSGATTCDRMIDYIISEESLFILEGKNMLIEEFGKEYTNYFSILSSIARGVNTRSEIEAAVGREIGGYLSRLEGDFSLISKSMPIYSKVSTKNVRYVLNDNFLTFWFRFVYKYSHIIEIGGYDSLREIVRRDYKTFSGVILERYFRDKFIESKAYSRIGGYWNRKRENEIDIVAVNELTGVVDIVEVKRKRESIDIELLEAKATYLRSAISEINPLEFNAFGLSMGDM